jgi:hypothetical protein
MLLIVGALFIGSLPPHGRLLEVSLPALSLSMPKMIPQDTICVNNPLIAPLHPVFQESDVGVRFSKLM